MKTLITIVTALALMAAGPASADEGVTPLLKMNTTYHFMYFSVAVPAAPLPGRPPGALWLLAWEGTVRGDIEGVIRWWVEFFPPDLTGVGRFELWDCVPEYPISCDYENPDLLLMAGNDAFGYVSATDWEGKGLVTYANGEYAEWFSQRITDGGWVDFDPDGVPLYGEGSFVIYDRPSNKH